MNEETNQQPFNSRSIIDKLRGYLAKYPEEFKEDSDLYLRLVRSFNMLHVHNELGTTHLYSRIILLWGSFNNIYADSESRTNKKEVKKPEIEIFTGLFKEIVSYGDRSSAKVANDELPKRYPKGDWYKLIVNKHLDDCKTLAECEWAYPENMEKDKIAKQQAKLVKAISKKSLTVLEQTIVRIYYLRNHLVHGSIDPGSKFLRREFECAASILPSILAFSLQVIFEHPKFFRDQVRYAKFGQLDDNPYTPKLYYEEPKIEKTA